MLPFLLHAANRNIKNESDEVRNAFYAIKDKILKRWGKVLGYDIQKIPGKVCNSCCGKGQHPKHGHNGKIYDWADCYHCFGGWYRFPKWIYLHRIKFGRYQFHKPLKRHECVQNPFTEEELGWNVTERPIIKGYIEHESHWFGEWAILLLFAAYNWAMFKPLFEKKMYWKRVYFRNWIQNKKRLHGWIFWKPGIHIRSYYDPEFQHSEDDDLPF